MVSNNTFVDCGFGMRTDGIEMEGFGSLIHIIGTFRALMDGNTFEGIEPITTQQFYDEHSPFSLLLQASPS